MIMRKTVIGGGAEDHLVGSILTNLDHEVRFDVIKEKNIKNYF